MPANFQRDGDIQVSIELVVLMDLVQSAVQVFICESKLATLADAPDPGFWFGRCYELFGAHAEAVERAGLKVCESHLSALLGLEPHKQVLLDCPPERLGEWIFNPYLKPGQFGLRKISKAA